MGPGQCRRGDWQIPQAGIRNTQIRSPSESQRLIHSHSAQKGAVSGARPIVDRRTGAACATSGLVKMATSRDDDLVAARFAQPPWPR